MFVFDLLNINQEYMKRTRSQGRGELERGWEEAREVFYLRKPPLLTGQLVVHL